MDDGSRQSILAGFLLVLVVAAICVLTCSVAGCAASGNARQASPDLDVTASLVLAGLGRIEEHLNQQAGRDINTSGTPWYVSLGMISIVGVYVWYNEVRQRRNGSGKPKISKEPCDERSDERRLEAPADGREPGLRNKPVPAGERVIPAG